LTETSLAEALAYFEGYFELRRRIERIPGVQAAVFANDGIVFSTALGCADLENDIALTEDHLFRVASHSKTFTAVAIMRLVEQGALRLDDPASRWVEYLAGTPLAAVTVRELLAHTGGVIDNGRNADYWQLAFPFPDEARLREMLLTEDPAVLPRNDTWKYSNVGYSLVGLIAAAASGMSYNELVKQEIVDRLGLADTGPDLDPARAADYVVGYTSPLLDDRRAPIENVGTGVMAPATGFYSTARDLVTFYSAQFLGDERLLSDDSKREMQHSLRETNFGGRYGFGLQVVTVGERGLIGHGGGWPGQSTRTLADPHAKFAVSVVTNMWDAPVEALATSGVKIIDLAASKPRPEETVDLTRFTGQFANVKGIMDIALLGGRLYALNHSFPDPIANPAPLEIVDDRTLRVAGGPASYGELIRFTFADDRRVESVYGILGLTYVPIEDFVLPERVVLRADH
jgi:CubicO group peptidase (beta-lactamase class C family)